MNLCQVHSCPFIAESSIEGEFLVCALHDHEATRGVLEQLMLPGSYWYSDGRPIVLPVGELLPEHLVPREAPPGAIRAGECSRLLEVPDGPGQAYPAYDLTR